MIFRFAIILFSVFMLLSPAPAHATVSDFDSISDSIEDQLEIHERERTKGKEEKKERKNPYMGNRIKKEEKRIKVGLSEMTTSVVITSKLDFNALNEIGNTVAKCGQKAVITVHGKRLAINGKKQNAGTLKISPADFRTTSPLYVNGKPYRGHIILKIIKDGAMTVINDVALDDYISGVLAEEMAAGWPAEALKAQAVAARTFALYSLGKHSASGYDVCASTHCQVYGGVESETKETDAAVAATRGEVMMFNGKPIYAAFHASSGGMTAGSEEAGGEALPYLVPVRDDDSSAPNRRWSVELTAENISQKLKAAGYDIGTLKAAELSALTVGKSAPDRFPSGRVKSLKFIGTKKTVEIPGVKLRWILSLPSTLFDFRTGSGRVEFKKKESSLMIDGAGRGHGVGMSQWGARAMAKKQKYRDILRHYYKNVELKYLY